MRRGGRKETPHKLEIQSKSKKAQANSRLTAQASASTNHPDQPTPPDKTIEPSESTQYPDDDTSSQSSDSIIYLPSPNLENHDTLQRISRLVLHAGDNLEPAGLASPSTTRNPQQPDADQFSIRTRPSARSSLTIARITSRESRESKLHNPPDRLSLDSSSSSQLPPTSPSPSSAAAAAAAATSPASRQQSQQPQQHDPSASSSATASPFERWSSEHEEASPWSPLRRTSRELAATARKIKGKAKGKGKEKEKGKGNGNGNRKDKESRDG